MRYHLDDKPVNGTTFYVSMLLRLVMLLLGCGLTAAATPWLTFGQGLAVGVGVLLLLGAKTTVLTFRD